MRILLSIKCLGIYCESMVKWTFHPKSRFGMVLFMLISTEKHPEGWFPFLSLRKDFFFPSQSSTAFSVPMMFSHLHPMLLHNDMLQGISARDPTSPRVDWCHISCLAGSSCCTSSHAKFPCHEKQGIQQRDSHPPTVGPPKPSRAEFLQHRGISCCAESWHNRRIQAGWAKRKFSFALGRS